MMTFEAIDGGNGAPKQPAWQLTFSDANECAAAAAYWSTIVTTMGAAIVYDRAAAAVARARSSNGQPH
jgi:hypothetical protein